MDGDVMTNKGTLLH